jgi:hypothetical protein
MANNMSPIISALVARHKTYVEQGSLEQAKDLEMRLKVLGHEVETAAVEHRSETAEMPVRKRRRAVTDDDN